SSELDIQPVSLPQQAWYPNLRKDFQIEDLVSARQAVSQAESALAKARDADNKEADKKIDAAANAAQPINIAVAEATLVAAQADFVSFSARWTADFAKYGEPRDPAHEELARAAAAAERHTGLCKAKLALLQAEQALTTAQQAKDPAEAKAKAALTKA